MALYHALAQVLPSPVVELNRAVAVSMAFGPEAGLELVDALADEPALRDYHLLRSVRGDLLARLGHGQEARREFDHAAALAANEHERKLLRARARRRSGLEPTAQAPRARPSRPAAAPRRRCTPGVHGHRDRRDGAAPCFTSQG